MGMSGQLEHWLPGEPIDICVLEIVWKGLESGGGPGSSNCEGTSRVSAFSSTLHFSLGLQYILSVGRSHMAPGGKILMANL